MAKKTAQKTATKKTADNQSRGKLIRVPLRAIDGDSFENQRTGDFTIADTDESGVGNSFSELVASIEMGGQKDPVTARPRPDHLPPHTDSDGNPTGAEYQLVKGFRRFAALNLIGQRNDAENYLDTTYIDVIVKDLNDSEALEENVLENSARDNLTGPDLAWAAFNIQQRRKLDGRPISDNQLAGLMGKNQSHLSKILGIVKRAPKIAKLWQEAASPLTVQAMKDLSELPADQQEAEYQRINAEMGGKGNRRGTQRPPLETAINQAKRIATMLGALELQELITCNIDWSTDLAGIGVKVDDLTGADIRKVTAEAEKAYTDAKTVKPPKPAKEEKAKTADSEPPQATA